MKLRRHKSKRDRAADMVGSYLKLKTAGKAAKGATKAAKGTAAYKVAKRTPVVKRVPVVLGAAAAAFFAAKALGGSDQEQPA